MTARRVNLRRAVIYSLFQMIAKKAGEIIPAAIQDTINVNLSAGNVVEGKIVSGYKETVVTWHSGDRRQLRTQHGKIL